MTKLSFTQIRALYAALAVGIGALVLPFVVTFTPDKAIAAHLVGLVIAGLAAKALWRPDASDGILLAGAGALAIVIPVFALQVPAGATWTLPALGAIAFAIGLHHVARRDERDPTPPSTRVGTDAEA
ncbi:hypothetical protein ROJ8625_00316 [Roseivivax jejudonensis]|uniref:SPW repeat protein n=1 Tax=Roseivivax jejudonensis TaxID=1529041 RepID=A0A1X6Y6X6_9RHOB|nr:hypothetical protein [Roseivivax jejudonensis]SLN12139.1 hypothetical protein ROJ8625_00316 [Roseivivax jejudonensis]